MNRICETPIANTISPMIAGPALIRTLNSGTYKAAIPIANANQPIGMFAARRVRWKVRSTPLG